MQNARWCQQQKDNIVKLLEEYVKGKLQQKVWECRTLYATYIFAPLPFLLASLQPRVIAVVRGCGRIELDAGGSCHLTLQRYLEHNRRSMIETSKRLRRYFIRQFFLARIAKLLVKTKITR